MGVFVDSKGRSWEVVIDVPNIARVRTDLKINLLEVVVPNNELLDQLSDPCKLVDVLFVLCRDETDKRGVNDIDFGRAMTPDCLEDGFNCLLEGVVNFSPRGLRPAYQKVLDKAKKFQTVQIDKAIAMVNSSEFDAMLEEALKKIAAQNAPMPSRKEFTGAAGSLQESLESSRESEAPLPP